MNRMPSKTVAVIGAGRIGRAWAIVFARSGFTVRIHDASQEMLDEALPAIRQSIDDLSFYNLVDEPAATIMSRITPCITLAEAVTEADLVQENIAEVVEVKRAMFAELDRLAKADAVLASSTSGLPASTFTEGLDGRARCLIGHPVNPPSLVPLVELCGAPWTSPETLKRASALYKQAGQVPVTVNHEISGFLLNRLQGAVLDEALSLFEQGYASAADLDAVMRVGLAPRWSTTGIFETIDLNAPGGVKDYASRYGGMYRGIAASRVQFDWSAETIDKLDSERRAELSSENIEQRSRWRDRRLMSLLAHARGPKTTPI
jgi:L-gulonate 3-dehydrogenase